MSPVGASFSAGWAAVVAAVIAAGVSFATTLVTKLWLDRRAYRKDAETAYKYEQLKALHGVVGSYFGRLLDTTTSWHYRMSNIYAYGTGRLNASGMHGRAKYFFNSTLYRFLALQTFAQLFENEHIYIEPRLLEEGGNLDLVKFVKALHWAVSDAELFAGLEYRKSELDDHIPSDRLRAICEAFLDDKGSVPSFRAFEARLRAHNADEQSELRRAFKLFDGVSPTESRFRWDRIVCLHLLTLAFIRRFGYDPLLSSYQADIENAVSRIKHERIAKNFVEWLPRLGLAEDEALDEMTRQLGRRISGELAFRDTIDATVDNPTSLAPR
jgi:hypothetical protein